MSNINKYANSKIYIIQQIGGEGLKYYGSTTQTLNERFSGHKCAYNQWKNGNNRTKCTSGIIFDTYGIKNVEIILLQKCCCSSKLELLNIESSYIRTEKCVNRNIPDRTRQNIKIILIINTLNLKKNIAKNIMK
jgi:hypothetical protein